jgi:hypothetical protein
MCDAGDDSAVLFLVDHYISILLPDGISFFLYLQTTGSQLVLSLLVSLGDMR